MQTRAKYFVAIPQMLLELRGKAWKSRQELRQAMLAKESQLVKVLVSHAAPGTTGIISSVALT